MPAPAAKGPESVRPFPGRMDARAGQSRGLRPCNQSAFPATGPRYVLGKSEPRLHQVVLRAPR
jgi:hypothetical protein